MEKVKEAEGAEWTPGLLGTSMRGGVGRAGEGSFSESLGPV